MTKSTKILIKLPMEITYLLTSEMADYQMYANKLHLLDFKNKHYTLVFPDTLTEGLSPTFVQVLEHELSKIFNTTEKHIQEHISYQFLGSGKIHKETKKTYTRI